jgi:hypothetical protein
MPMMIFIRLLLKNPYHFASNFFFYLVSAMALKMFSPETEKCIFLFTRCCVLKQAGVMASMVTMNPKRHHHRVKGQIVPVR